MQETLPMELDPNQTSDIMKRFPTFELSYETVSHKKVSHDYNTCLAIPYGKKGFLWYTFFRDQNVCFFMELGRDKKVASIRVIKQNITTELAYGTLFYGCIVPLETDKKTVFVIEDVFFFHGISLAKCPFSEKLGWIQSFFQTYGPHLTDQFAITLPVMWKVDEVEPTTHPVIPLKWKNHIPYPIHHFQYRALNAILPLINVPNTTLIAPSLPTNCGDLDVFIPPPLPRFDFTKSQYKHPAFFEVKADLQNDIYHLYAFAKGSDRVYCGLAYIANYRTSVMMNRLFRKIRENENIDYIEESEDEDDFQDTRLDKHVDLKKTHVLECTFMPKFKRWMPVRLIKTRAEYQGKVVHISKL